MCGIAAVVNHPEAANACYLMLHSLQHRGQEGSGIVTTDGESHYSHRRRGLVGDVFSNGSLSTLKGNSAIGHNRYSTAGGNTVANLQPFSVKSGIGWLSIAHNGNLVNGMELTKYLESEGSIFQSTSDTEVIIHLIAKSKKKLPEALIDSLYQVQGAYSLLVLNTEVLIAVRDPLGIRPLVLGDYNESPVFSSETTAFDLIGASYVREIDPGEMVVVSLKDGSMESLRPFDPCHRKRCVFEYVYFARPDSTVFGASVFDVRKALGRRLAQEQPAKADVVIPVPDSGNGAAIGYSQESKIPYDMGLIRSHYVGRCVGADELITVDNGERIKASNLVGKSFNLLTCVEGKIKSVPAKASLNLIEDVYEITTESGRTIVRSGNHPLWAASAVFKKNTKPKIDVLEWMPVDALDPQRHIIAVTEELPAFGNKRMSDWDVSLLGYLIGDGGMTTSNITFTQQNGKQLEDFKKCVKHKGCDCVPVLHGKYGWRVTSGRRGYHPGRNSVLTLIRNHRLLGCHGDYKRIPEEIFCLSREKQALFLSKLYSTDGWAACSKNGCVEIGFASNSYGLVADVASMLIRFGVSGNISKKKNSKFRLTEKNGKHSWVVSIRDKVNIIRFCDRIGIYGKELSVGRVLDKAKQRIRRRHAWKWRDAPQNTFWERIASIKKLNKQQTIAIEVPGHHTFFSEFWEHNSFILPDQESRNFGVKLKLNAISSTVKNKSVVVVDDSLVRGTTSRKIIKMIRDAGAREVHLRISSPPTTDPCFYGIDTPSKKDLIASSADISDICKYIGADTLGYLSPMGLTAVAMRFAGEGFCTACFTGNYPIQLNTEKLRKNS